MTILREVTKEKGHQVWNDTHEYQYWESVPLYDSLPKTMNRVARQSRKAIKNNTSNDTVEAMYYIGNQGLFNLETDLKMILWDIYKKVTHKPTKQKIAQKIDLLSGQQHDYSINDYFYRERISLLENIANDTIGYHWSEGSLEDSTQIIDNQTLFNLNRASIEEKINFCIKEYRKTIKFIQKCLDENEITCEIVGDCYLDF